MVVGGIRDVFNWWLLQNTCLIELLIGYQIKAKRVDDHPHATTNLYIGLKV